MGPKGAQDRVMTKRNISETDKRRGAHPEGKGTRKPGIRRATGAKARGAVRTTGKQTPSTCRAAG